MYNYLSFIHLQYPLQLYGKSLGHWAQLLAGGSPCTHHATPKVLFISPALYKHTLPRPIKERALTLSPTLGKFVLLAGFARYGGSGRSASSGGAGGPTTCVMIICRKRELARAARHGRTTRRGRGAAAGRSITVYSHPRRRVHVFLSHPHGHLTNSLSLSRRRAISFSCCLFTAGCAFVYAGLSTCVIPVFFFFFRGDEASSDTYL